MSVGQVEKPFGKDLRSSRELQRALAPDWKEEEVFRIDHYLGKEMVKNILILRFGNEFFGATWNRRHIDNVQVRLSMQFPDKKHSPTRIRLLLKSHLVPKVEAATSTSLASSVMSCRTVSDWNHREN